jgi:hypothetical protein
MTEQQTLVAFVAATKKQLIHNSHFLLTIAQPKLASSLMTMPMTKMMTTMMTMTMTMIVTTVHDE